MNFTATNFTDNPSPTKHKTMNDIILVVLPDGSVHRATLIEPGLGAPVYQLGKKAGSKERKPRTKTQALAISRGPANAGVALAPNERLA